MELVVIIKSGTIDVLIAVRAVKMSEKLNSNFVLKYDQN